MQHEVKHLKQPKCNTLNTLATAQQPSTKPLYTP